MIRRWVPLAAVLLVAFPGPALAHSPMPGIEGFYLGLRHPLSTPDQALALIACGLLLGSFALRRMTPGFVGLAGGLLAGFVLGQGGGDPAPWLYGLAAGAAVWAALLPGRGRVAACALAVLAGALLGWASVPEDGPVRDRVITMLGSFLSVSLLTLYLAGSVDMLRERFDAPWLGIALRVVAASVAAVAILMLALVLAGPGP